MPSESVDIFQEIAENKFLLILMEEKEYISRLEEIIRPVEKNMGRICYVCLSKPYINVIEDLESMGIGASNFFFIDIMTSHYKEPRPVENCIFLSDPNNLTKIRLAIKRAVDENKCSIILFDTISTLLIYQQTSSIVRFTHSLISEKEQENVKKLFLMIKGNDVPIEESKRLANDLGMFADKTLDISLSNSSR